MESLKFETLLLDIWTYLLGSGIFLTLLGLFYKFGKHEQKIDNKFDEFERSISAIQSSSESLKYFGHDIDKKLSLIDCKIDKNLFGKKYR